MSYSLNSVKGGYIVYFIGGTIGVIKGDTRSLDYSSNGSCPGGNLRYYRAPQRYTKAFDCVFRASLIILTRHRSHDVTPESCPVVNGASALQALIALHESIKSAFGGAGGALVNQLVALIQAHCAGTEPAPATNECGRALNARMQVGLRIVLWQSDSQPRCTTAVLDANAAALYAALQTVGGTLAQMKYNCQCYANKEPEALNSKRVIQKPRTSTAAARPRVAGLLHQASQSAPWSRNLYETNK